MGIASRKQWKVLKISQNVFLRAGGPSDAAHRTRGDSANGMLWPIKSFSRGINPNIMSKMCWRCSFSFWRAISDAYLHVAVTRQTTEQTPTGSIKTRNWSKRLYRQSSCYLICELGRVWSTWMSNLLWLQHHLLIFLWRKNIKVSYLMTAQRKNLNLAHLACNRAHTR